mmetsp:Transcript_30981/g.100101  ORF Transcript_30981/g.100101 Transcript_30981/m.100101 type:complete len:499 (-) Transcript_30981:21-1517(-)
MESWDRSTGDCSATVAVLDGLRSRLERGCLGPGVLVDSAHHGLELLARPRLDVRGAAEGDEVLGALLPLDRLDQLPLEQGPNLVHRAVRLASHVGVDLDRRHLDGRLVERLAQRIGRRRHVRRVEGARHGQHLCVLGAHGHHNLAQLLEHLGVTRASAALGEHVVGDVGLLAAAHRRARLVERVLQHGVRAARHGSHRALVGVSSGVHRLGARLDQLEALLKGERAGKDEGRVLAQREPGGHLDLFQHLRRVLLGLLHGGERADKDGRLRVERCVELLLGSLGAEADHVIAQNLGGHLKHCLHGLVLQQFGGHPDLLRALAGEEDGDVALGLRGVGPRLGGRRRLGGFSRGLLLLLLLALFLLLEKGVSALLALLDVVLVVRRLAGERHVPVVEARDAVEILLRVCLVGHALQHRLDLLRLEALLDAVLIVADEDSDMVALVILILALAQTDDRRWLGGCQIHHVLKLEVLELLLELLDVKGTETFAPKVGHGFRGGV